MIMKALLALANSVLLHNERHNAWYYEARYEGTMRHAPLVFSGYRSFTMVDLSTMPQYHGYMRSTKGWRSLATYLSMVLLSTMASSIFMCVCSHYRIYDNDYKLPITSVATSFQPICKIISLSSVKLVKLKALWPSTKVERGDTVMYRFVPL